MNRYRRLTRSSCAKKINEPSVSKAIDESTARGSGWLDWASNLTRRVYKALDWEPLGDHQAPYSLLASRGEAAVFWDGESNDRVLKLRGPGENGFMGGFGSILGPNSSGQIDFLRGTLEQAIEREAISWSEFGFGCTLEAVLEEDAGALFAQQFINGVSPTPQEISEAMEQDGWESVSENSQLDPQIRKDAWYRNGILAVDGNPTNFVKSRADGKVYAIDLIVWRVDL